MLKNQRHTKCYEREQRLGETFKFLPYLLNPILVTNYLSLVVSLFDQLHIRTLKTFQLRRTSLGVQNNIYLAQGNVS